MTRPIFASLESDLSFLVGKPIKFVYAQGYQATGGIAYDGIVLGWSRDRDGHPALIVADQSDRCREEGGLARIAVVSLYQHTVWIDPKVLEGNRL